jgi:outer membrane lipoprotein SlyB
MPVPRRRLASGFGVALLAVLVLSGCARPPQRAAQIAPSPAPAVATGVIAAMRPLAAPTADTARAILAAIGMGGAAAVSRPADETEFVVSEDGGRTVSIVQPNDAGLHPGERVALTPGARTRIIRLAAAGS